MSDPSEIRKQYVVRGLCPTMYEGDSGHVIMEFVFDNLEEAREFVLDRQASYRNLHIKADIQEDI